MTVNHLTFAHCVTQSVTSWLLHRMDNMQVHGSKRCSMNQGGVTTMELVSPLHLFSIPVRPEHCVLKQRDGKRMANFASVSKHVITMRATVVTEANVVQPCIDPSKVAFTDNTKKNNKQINRWDWLWSPANTKGPAKMAARFMFEGPRPCTIFCLHSFTMH